MLDADMHIEIGLDTVVVEQGVIHIEKEHGIVCHRSLREYDFWQYADLLVEAQMSPTR